MPMGNAYARIKPSDAEPDALRSAGPRVLQYTSALRALRIRTRVLVGAEPDALRSREAHARCAPLVYVQYASPPGALRTRTRVLVGGGT